MGLSVGEYIEFKLLDAELLAKGIFNGSGAMHEWDNYVRYLRLEAKKNGWPELRWRDNWRP
jgi:hypothetical protein